MPPGILSKPEYQQIMQNPGVYLTDPMLRQCQVEKEPTTLLPRVRSGGLALTYRITHNNKKWALRCFHKLAPSREHHYGAISKFLATKPSKILINIVYQPKGIRYQGSFYPITIMEWVDGDTLGTFVFNNMRNPSAIQNLPNQFLNVVRELNSLQIAHGDLSHSNIMLSNGNMVLIDYDGMYVPELCGQRSGELGNINFQHPGRDENIFGPDLDRFSEIVIYLALKAISISPRLYQTFGLGGEGLLFNQTDFREPNSSKLIAEIEKLPDLAESARNFKRLCQSSVTKIPTLEDFIKNIPIEVTLEVTVPVGYPIQPGLWPINATHMGELLENENENVVVIGKIDRFRKDLTWRGDPYVFLNVGIWPNQTFTVVMWSEVLTLLQRAGRRPEDFQDKWISVSGIISEYSGKPQIVLESPADIAIISEAEATARLNRKNQVTPQVSKPVIRSQQDINVPRSFASTAPKTPTPSQVIPVIKPSASVPVNPPTNIVTSIPSKPGDLTPPSTPVSFPPSPNSQFIKPKLDVTGKLDKLYGASGPFSNQPSNSTSPSDAGNPSATPSSTGKSGNLPQVLPAGTVSTPSGQGIAGINRTKRESMWKRFTDWLKGNP